MLKHSVQIELFPILWVTKLIYSESPMYPMLDKDTIKMKATKFYQSFSSDAIRK